MIFPRQKAAFSLTKKSTIEIVLNVMNLLNYAAKILSISFSLSKKIKSLSLSFFDTSEKPDKTLRIYSVVIPSCDAAHDLDNFKSFNFLFTFSINSLFSSVFVFSMNKSLALTNTLRNIKYYYTDMYV